MEIDDIVTIRVIKPSMNIPIYTICPNDVDDYDYIVTTKIKSILAFKNTPSIFEYIVDYENIHIPNYYLDK